MYKALSTKYNGRMAFGMVDAGDTKLAAQFGATALPAMYIVEHGKSLGEGGYKPIEYTGKSQTFTRLDFWVMDFAKTPTGKSIPETDDGTVGKKKKANRLKSSSTADAKGNGTPEGFAAETDKNKEAEAEEETAAAKKAERKAKRDQKRKEEQEKKKAAEKANLSKKKASKKKLGKLRNLKQPENPIKLKGIFPPAEACASDSCCECASFL